MRHPAPPHAPWRAQLEASLGARVVGATPVGGGCIHAAQRVDLDDGQTVFLKSSVDTAPGLFAAEAAGLRWLAGFEAIGVPEVLAFADATTTEPGFLALRWIHAGSIDGGRFGADLARLHRYACPLSAAPDSAFIGPLPQDNRPAPDWPRFWAERRLRPMAARAGEALPGSLRRDIDRLCDGLPVLLEDVSHLGPLHGDLWSGNAMADTSGRPIIFDPAASVGDPEVDLAMMALFGGFDRSVWRAYRRAHPAPVDEARRRAIYQVWPLLVHVVLFGGGYLAQLQAAVRRALGPR